jgi:probable HAF family extracellular repeat protein
MKLAILALALGAVSTAPAHAEAPWPKYRVTVLKGDGVDPAFVSGLALNNRGDVTGYARFGDPLENRYGSAFLFQDGKLSALAPLSGTISRGLDLNDHGEVAGYFLDAATSNKTPFLYSKGRVIDVSTPLHPDSTGEAVAINNRGQVLGALAVGGTFLYDKGKARYIPADASLPYHPPSDINDRGDVVGQIWRDCCTYGGYVISDGKLRRLPTLGGDYSFANAINNNGLIVGRSWTADMHGYQAVVYRGSDIQSLGTLGGIFGNARDVNDAGWIVGQSTLANGLEAGFVYHDGVMRNLNELLAGDIGKLRSVHNAVAINERGQILAYSTLNNVYHTPRTVILTPVPEASTLAMLAAGLGVVGWTATRRRKTAH